MPSSEEYLKLIHQFGFISDEEFRQEMLVSDSKTMKTVYLGSITGSSYRPELVIPDHIETMNIKLGLHICPWCKQSVYIGEQIKDIVALSCPNCGGSLHTGE